MDGAIHQAPSKRKYCYDCVPFKNKTNKNRIKIRISSRIKRQNKKQEMVNLFGGKCSKCRYDKCLQALTFHHTKDKEFGISGSHARSSSKIINELAKCVLLCANCHQELKNTRTIKNDLNWNCICAECGRKYLFTRSKGHTREKCNSCMTKERRIKRRNDIISILGGKCSKCGRNKSLVVHHLSEKTIPIGKNVLISKRKIVKELTKCILLCANCHIELHWSGSSVVEQRLSVPPLTTEGWPSPVYGNGLENRRSVRGPWVRIPPLPPFDCVD